MQTMQIPVDQRNGRPKITNEMKAACIGEFEFEVPDPRENEDGEMDYEATRTVSVPWTLCKTIYERMARVAADCCAAPDSA